MRSSVAVAAAGADHRDMLTSQSVAALIFTGVVLIVLAILGGGRFDVLALGAALLFGAGLFQTIDNRRAIR